MRHARPTASELAFFGRLSALVPGVQDFRPILDDVRRDLAEQLLADMDRSLSEVASHLEFDDRSSFNRAALRWWGQSPSQMRGRRVAARDSEGESDRLRRSRLQG